MFLVLAHLAALMAAAIAVAFGDYALLGRRRVDGRLLYRASTGVAWALVGLWVTGLALIGVDTAFDWAVLLAKPKVLAKLTVVLLLTANGIHLHRTVLPSLTPVQPPARREARRIAAQAAVAGGVSAACWTFGVFLGVARPLAPVLGYTGFVAVFGVVLLAAVLVARQLAAPRLVSRLCQATSGGRGCATRGPRRGRLDDAAVFRCCVTREGRLPSGGRPHYNGRLFGFRAAASTCLTGALTALWRAVAWWHEGRFVLASGAVPFVQAAAKCLSCKCFFNGNQTNAYD